MAAKGKRMTVDEATERAAKADAWIVILDTRIRRLQERQALWIEERKAVAPFMRKIRQQPPDLVLYCGECSISPFPVDSALTELLNHTMLRHGRRPTMAERTPVPR